MIDLNKYRVIDVSYELVPGELKVDGTYTEGETLFNRQIEVEEFIAYTARMHRIRTITHTGTHMESPYKYFEKGADVGSMPLTTYMGEAVVCDFSKKPRRGVITADDFRRAGVKRGDIVLGWSGGREGEREDWPHIDPSAIQWLIKTKIKLIAMECTYFSPRGTAYGKTYADYKLLKAGISLLDCVRGLNRIKKKRVFFMALPVPMRRVTAAWCRAVVFEEK